MHRSKPTAALVDVPAPLFDREVEFWSGALGRAPEFDADDPDYRDFGQPVPGFQFMVQRVGAGPRVHLDIETDDVEAEVRRLEALGAVRVQPVKSWWVMRDPAGMLFCVVRVQTGEVLNELATTWPASPAAVAPEVAVAAVVEEHSVVEAAAVLEGAPVVEATVDG